MTRSKIQDAASRGLCSLTMLLPALVLAVLLVTTLPGCGGAASDLSPAVQAVARLATPPASGAAHISPGNPDEAQPTEQETEPALKFKPPYPDRTNPFKLPNVARSVRRKMRDGASVALKGFVSVDGVQAILEVNGELGAYREGDQTDGVLVVQISPPNVILQRGRTRWTATLFEGG